MALFFTNLYAKNEKNVFGQYLNVFVIFTYHYEMQQSIHYNKVKGFRLSIILMVCLHTWTDAPLLECIYLINYVFLVLNIKGIVHILSLFYLIYYLTKELQNIKFFVANFLMREVDRQTSNYLDI